MVTSVNYLKEFILQSFEWTDLGSIQVSGKLPTYPSPK